MDSYGSSWEGREVLILIRPRTSVCRGVAFACTLWKTMAKGT